MKFKGVSEDRRKLGKVTFKARLYIDRTTYKSRCGFDTAEAAATAYDDLAREFYGDTAMLNFPRAGEKSTITVVCVNCGSSFEVQGTITRPDRAKCSEKCRVAHQLDWQRNWRKKNPEIIKRQNRDRMERYRANPDFVRAQRRAWTESKIAKDPSFREKKREYNLAYRAKNIDRLRDYNRKRGRMETAAIAALRNLGLLTGEI